MSAYLNSVSKGGLILAWGTIPESELTHDVLQCLTYFCGPREKNEPIFDTINRELFSNFDWRNQNIKLGPVLYQGNCGACWAFATCSAFTDRIKINSKTGTSNLNLCLHPNTLSVLLEKTESRSSSIRLTLRGTEGRTRIIEKDVKITNNTNPLENDYLSPFYFASCDACEIASKLEPKITELFKELNLCSKNSCDGSSTKYAHVTLILNGVISSNCNPQDGKYICGDYRGCVKYRPEYVYSPGINLDWSKPITNQQLQENELEIMRDIYKNGPVTAGMKIYTSFYRMNCNNISDRNFCYNGWESSWYSTPSVNTPIYVSTLGNYVGGHAINIMGWGSINITVNKNSNNWVTQYAKKLYSSWFNQKLQSSDININVPIRYWICKNSWSTTWGNNGYFSILRGINLSGIEEEIWSTKPLKVYKKQTETTSTITDINNIQLVDNCSQCTSNECFRKGIDNQLYICEQDKMDIKIINNCPL
jgi:hypothetical protein